MKNLLIILFLLFSFQLTAQNSTPYANTSLVHLKSISPEIEAALHDLDVTFLSCREHQSSSDIIVSETALNWLSNNEVVFETLVSDLKQKIDNDNAAMELVRSQRDGEEWYTIYRTYDEVQDKLVEIANSSSVATLIDLGDSYENRAIKGLKFSTGGTDKPAVFFNGCQHAREWVTVMATTYFADQLAQQYISDSFTESLLDLVDVYIIPIVNPDGYVYTHTTDRYWRKNRQPNTNSSCVGTDLNRNWEADWNGGESTSTSECSDIYVGSGAFSATEATVLKNYMESIPNLKGHLDIHSYSALVLGPWGYTNTESPDHAEIVSLGNAMNDAITNTNNYPFTFGVGDADGAIYLASGTMPDWSYDELGALGYTFELRPNSSSGGGFELPESQILDACAENYNGAMEMIIWAADIQSGCMDASACNYDANATVDDGSCAELDECGECGGSGPSSGYDCDGNCITGETLTIQLEDSYGDGWNGNNLTINGTSITMNSGTSSTEILCYDSNTCISVSCDGGSWQEEVSWTILNSDGEELLIGGAPFTGEFGNCSSEIPGCTDPLATNYNALATFDDGSCEYSSATDVQIISLPLGWFIFSTYIQPQTPAINDLVSSIFEATIIVKDAEGLAYLPNWDFNGIGNAIDGEAYLIKLSENQNLSISGTKIIPEDFVINLETGWSLLGYLRDSPANLVTMLADINEQIIIVKTFDGTAYLPDWNFNGIGDMSPGQGYQIKVNSNVSFSYPPN
ncbi:MAG: M14 family zinc carboxypeptidase [Flavobacteriales bacterium]|jgi:murein tripeptide amidase MpaA